MDIFNLEVLAGEEYSSSHDPSLNHCNRIGERIYQRLEQQLLQKHSGKYVFILPGTSNISHAYVITPVADFEELEQDLLQKIITSFPGRVFYQRYIGNKEEDPYRHQQEEVELFTPFFDE